MNFKPGQRVRVTVRGEAENAEVISILGGNRGLLLSLGPVQLAEDVVGSLVVPVIRCSDGSYWTPRLGRLKVEPLQ